MSLKRAAVGVNHLIKGATESFSSTKCAKQYLELQ